MSALAVITETPLGSGCWRWRITGTLRVAGKGDLTYSASDPGCQRQSTATLPFAVTGGSGKYAGASGSGTLAIPSFTEATLTGLQTWTGTLDVPGLEFDTAPPALHGAVGKTVRANGRRSVAVRYAVTATDAVDGPVPAVCKPRSGSRFRVGRTTVRCTATDTSGNAAAAAFRITVKR